MTDCDDYLSEMKFDESTDHDIESLFEGSLDSANELASVANVFEVLRAESTVVLDEATITGLARTAADATNPASAAPAAVDAGGSTRARLVASLRRRVAATAVAATVFLGGMSGLAAAADGAKPGDALYGVDRAFETIGIGNGTAAERLVEVRALVEIGEVQRGLRHAANVVEKQSDDSSGASAALEEAAVRVLDNGSEVSAATRERVSGLLTYISENVGDLDGRQVAELAREIGRSDNGGKPSSEAKPPKTPGPPEEPGPPDHSPAEPAGGPKGEPGPPTEAPGRSGDAPGSANRPNNKP